MIARASARYRVGLFDELDQELLGLLRDIRDLCDFDHDGPESGYWCMDRHPDFIESAERLVRAGLMSRHPDNPLRFTNVVEQAHASQKGVA